MGKALLYLNPQKLILAEIKKMFVNLSKNKKDNFDSLVISKQNTKYYDVIKHILFKYTACNKSA